MARESDIPTAARTVGSSQTPTESATDTAPDSRTSPTIRPIPNRMAATIHHPDPQLGDASRYSGPEKKLPSADWATYSATAPKTAMPTLPERETTRLTIQTHRTSYLNQDSHPAPINLETDGLSPRPNKLGPRYVSRPTHPKKRLVEMTSRLFLVPLVGLEPTLCRF